MSVYEGDEPRRPDAGEGDASFGLGGHESDTPAGSESPFPNFDPPTVELGSPQGQPEERAAMRPEPAEHAHGEAGSQERGDFQQRGYAADMSADTDSTPSDQGASAEQPSPAWQAPQPAEAAAAEPTGQFEVSGTADPAADEDTTAGHSAASNGAGPWDQVGPPGSHGEAAWWQRPEAAIGAAFVGGLLVAAILKRRRS